MAHHGLKYLLSACLLSALLAGCGVSPSQPAVVPQCTLPASSPTTYQVSPEKWVGEIYSHVVLSDASVKEEATRQARYAAFKILSGLTNRWSDYIDVPLPDTGNVRITLTYISPELIEGILLNQMLFKGEVNYSDAQFTELIMAGLDRAVKRGEMLFLMSITSTRYEVVATNSKIVSAQIPIADTKLTNSSDVGVPPSHYDHSLDQYISLHGPFSGYITYQMTVKNGENCGLLLDPAWNNTISIHVSSLKVNDVDYGQQTWTILYEPLLEPSTSTEAPDYAYLPATVFGDLSSSPDAPTPLNLPATAPGYWDGYWQMMARYVWGQIMYTNR